MKDKRVSTGGKGSPNPAADPWVTVGDSPSSGLEFLFLHTQENHDGSRGRHFFALSGEGTPPR